MANILLAEDDADFLEVLRQLLSGAGHQVTIASTGAEAFERTLSHTFDLVITDICMPDGDGMEIIQAVRKRNAGTKFIALSGGGLFAANEYLDAAMKLGASGVLTKPVACSELLAHVNALLREPRAARAA